MKRKVGELYHKPIVIGNKNEVTDNEIHISEVTNSEIISSDDILYFIAGTNVGEVLLNLSKKQVIDNLRGDVEVVFSDNTVNIYSLISPNYDAKVALCNCGEFKFKINQTTKSSEFDYEVTSHLHYPILFSNYINLGRFNSDYSGVLTTPNGKEYIINVINTI